MNSNCTNNTTLTCLNDRIDGSCYSTILNPISFFMPFDSNHSNIILYGNRNMCIIQDESNGFDTLSNFLVPFCLNLLPFAVVYSFCRFMITIISFYYGYIIRIKKKIELLKLVEDITERNKRIYFSRILLVNYIADIINASIGWIIFKGYQFYASSNYTNQCITYTSINDHEVIDAPSCNQEGNLCLQSSNPILIIASIIWFLSEITIILIQIFAVSTLTHVNTYDKNNYNFIFKHLKWATGWALSYAFIGGLLLIMSFASPNNYLYKIYYKFYTNNTITFWLCYSLVFILVIIDRYLAYEGFKRRSNIRIDNRLLYRDINLDDKYENEFKIDEPCKQEIELYMINKFNNIDNNVIKKDVDHVIKEYNQKLKEHIDEIKIFQMNCNLDDKVNPNNLTYVKFLLTYHIINLIGYIIILISYKDNTFRLNVFLFGIAFIYFATFIYELSNSYLLYRGLFGCFKNSHNCEK